MPLAGGPGYRALAGAGDAPARRDARRPTRRSSRSSTGRRQPARLGHRLLASAGRGAQPHQASMQRHAAASMKAALRIAPANRLMPPMTNGDASRLRRASRRRARAAHRSSTCSSGLPSRLCHVVIVCQTFVAVDSAERNAAATADAHGSGGVRAVCAGRRRSAMPARASQPQRAGSTLARPRPTSQRRCARSTS